MVGPNLNTLYGIMAVLFDIIGTLPVLVNMEGTVRLPGFCVPLRYPAFPTASRIMLSVRILLNILIQDRFILAGVNPLKLIY